MLKLLRTVLLALALAGLPVQAVIAHLPSCPDHAPASTAQAGDLHQQGDTPAGSGHPCTQPGNDGVQCHCCATSAPAVSLVTLIVHSPGTYPAAASVRYLGFEPELAKPPPLL